MSGLLPHGIRVGAGLDVNDRAAVRVDITETAKGSVAVVCTPREARAWGALLLKQADLVEAAERARGAFLGVLP